MRDFYARRARRILPAATLVTLATLVGSLIWISAVDALEVVKDALWATFFAANVRFASVGTDYFAQEDGPSPLQHYWSLAVEEQFYLVWPLVLLACVWLARRRRPRRRARGRTAAAPPARRLLGAARGVRRPASCYGVLLTEDNPTAAYFSTPARAWELAVGALTALVARAVAGRLSSLLRGLVACTGVGAIADRVLELRRVDRRSPAPPLCCRCWARRRCCSPARAVTSASRCRSEPWALRPMRVVGDWSYSLYLWHWPLLVIPELDQGRPLSAGQAVTAVAATFVLAALTYRYVETPFRSPRRFTRPRALRLYPASVALVALSCGLGNAYGAEPGRWRRRGDHGRQLGARGRARREGQQERDHRAGAGLGRGCTRGPRDPSRPAPRACSTCATTSRASATATTASPTCAPCARAATPGADKTIVVLGNSHGRMWIPAFDAIAEREGYSTYYFVKPNCTAADLRDQRRRHLHADGPVGRLASEFREWALDQIAELRPDIAVVATSGPNPVIFDGERQVKQGDPDRIPLTEQGFADIFDRLAAISDRVVLLRDVPKSADDPGDCLTTGSPDLGDCMFTPIEAQELDSEASVAGAEQTGTEVIDPMPWLCWQDECPVVIGDVLPYRDRGHLSTVYAGELADEIGRKLGIWTEDDE